MSGSSARESQGNQVTQAVRMLNLAVESWRSAFARQHRITPTDSVILTTLLAHGGQLRPRDIAKPLCITAGTLTAMLDRLQARDFVARTPHPTDRRSVLVTLTPAGRTAMTTSYTAFADGVAQAVPERHRELYARLLLDTASVISGIVDGMVDDIDM